MANKTHHMTKKYGDKNGNLTARIHEYSEQLDDVVNEAVLTLYANLVKDTPVGNPSLWQSNYYPKDYIGGTARANWRIVEMPDDKVIHSTNLPSTPTLPKQWTKLYIINNVPWIIPLEYGHSRQIEAGWVRRNLDNFNHFIKEAKNERPK